MEKLPVEIKKKWVIALKSEKFKQANGVLKNELGYCCLGVLCEVQKIEPDGYSYSGLDNPDPEVLRVLTQIKDGDTRSFEGILVRMNDYSRNFSEIADWIEVNL